MKRLKNINCVNSKINFRQGYLSFAFIPIALKSRHQHRERRKTRFVLRVILKREKYWIFFLLHKLQRLSFLWWSFEKWCNWRIGEVNYFFKRLPRPGGRTWDILVLIYFLFQLQHLRSLGYCSPPPFVHSLWPFVTMIFLPVSFWRPFFYFFCIMTWNRKPIKKTTMRKNPRSCCLANQGRTKFTEGQGRSRVRVRVPTTFFTPKICIAYLCF